MKKSVITFTATAALLLCGCSSMGKFTTDNFTVTPTPLEYVAGEVPTTINVNLPAKFMNKKAVITCTPVVRWQGGEQVGSSVTFQGEKVEANHQIISYKNGGRATLRTTFPFREGMESCDLIMRFNGHKGTKVLRLPDVQIGYGTICTPALVSQTCATAHAALGADQFRRVISQKQAATIKFLIAQSNLRGSELNSQNVQDFIQTLRNIKTDEQSLVLNNVEVSAYASPDGRYDFNEKLAERRGKTSADYVKEQMKKTRLEGAVDTKYTAEDWEGFQELVSQSHLQDKELILRVLSMYDDPEQREREIQNIATVYSELADAVLPELRRARMTINYDVIGRSDDQILSLIQNNQASALSVEELLYAGNLLTDDYSQKKKIYKETTERYPNDYRAYNNLGVISMNMGEYDGAEALLKEALAKNASAPEPNANLGLIALQRGDVKAAELYMAKGSGAQNIDEALGNLYIAQGKYNQAAAKLDGTATNSTVLAQLLAQDYASARQSLKQVAVPDAMTSYLRALLGARMGDQNLIREGLTATAQADRTLARRALNDLEFLKYKDLVETIVKP
ncbi:MAG: tetratricopeptide repeat protein [Bacteroidales bacterium]|nr:tetratricopeptide repeat protein [Bacteroidales bacterium]